jgi:hypothetical protein
MFGDGSTSISDIGDFDSKIGERLCQSPLGVQKRYRSGAFEEKDVRFKSKIKYSETPNDSILTPRMSQRSAPRLKL